MIGTGGSAFFGFDSTMRFFIDNFPSLETIVLGGPIGIAWSWLCLYFARYLKVYRRWKTGYSRKIFHFLIFTSVVAIQSIWGTSAVCLFGGMCSLVIFYAVYRGDGHLLYEAMARESDEPRRTLYIVIPYVATLVGGLVSNILFGPLAVIGYLVTGLGDAVGEPVGTRFGKHTYKVATFTSVRAFRSWEGSSAVFAASVIAILVAIALTPQLQFSRYSLLVVLMLGCTCALLEAVSPRGWDNATMQIAPTALGSWLM